MDFPSRSYHRRSHFRDKLPQYQGNDISITMSLKSVAGMFIHILAIVQATVRAAATVGNQDERDSLEDDTTRQQLQSRSQGITGNPSQQFLVAMV